MPKSLFIVSVGKTAGESNVCGLVSSSSSCHKPFVSCKVV